jgi:hypothetical protein
VTRILTTFALLAVALVVFAGVAFAGGTPSDDQYENETPGVVEEGGGGEEGGGVAGAVGEEEPTLVETVSGALPFTGFPALGVLAGGALLVASGVALRRRGSGRDD